MTGDRTSREPGGDSGSREGPLAGREVAMTGRLASMTWEEAAWRLAARGATWVRVPRETTDYLVVGQGGPPLDDEGRPTRSLLRARALQAAGAPLEVVHEEDFVAWLDPDSAAGGLERLFPTPTLARILDVPAREVRAWVRAGLLQPTRTVGRLELFDFAQAAGARAVARLTRAGVAPSRIARSLAQLREWLGEDAAAQELLLADHELVVRTEEGECVEPGGQLRLEFDAPGGDEVREAPAAISELRPSGGMTWYERGLRAEERGDLEAAADAYAQSLEHEPARADVAFNLGNVLYTLARREESLEAFGTATQLDPEYVEAWNNLGNVLGELGRAEQAIEAYTQALALLPQYADAHYNLGETLAALGDHRGAVEHWRAYLRLDPTSSWAGEVRQRLRDAEGRVQRIAAPRLVPLRDPSAE